MGICASSPSTTRTTRRDDGATWDFIGRPKGVVVIHVDGDRVQELKQPTQARAITSQHPNHVLCNSDALSVGTCAPRVYDEDDLQMGHIYFLMPLQRVQSPLSLPELCNLAIKASSALGKR